MTTNALPSTAQTIIEPIIKLFNKNEANEMLTTSRVGLVISDWTEFVIAAAAAVAELLAVVDDVLLAAAAEDEEAAAAAVELFTTVVANCLMAIISPKTLTLLPLAILAALIDVIVASTIPLLLSLVLQLLLLTLPLLLPLATSVTNTNDSDRSKHVNLELLKIMYYID